MDFVIAGIALITALGSGLLMVVAQVLVSKWRDHSVSTPNAFFIGLSTAGVVMIAWCLVVLHGVYKRQGEANEISKHILAELQKDELTEEPAPAAPRERPITKELDGAPIAVMTGTVGR